MLDGSLACVGADDDARQLLAVGGWRLGDVQARQSEHPDTFRLPGPVELDQMVAGTNARLLFEVVDQADPVRDGVDWYDDRGAPNLRVIAERMWLWVTERTTDGLVGVLMNQPSATHTRLVAGTTIACGLDRVMDTDLAPPISLGEGLDALSLAGFEIIGEAETRGPLDPTAHPRIEAAQIKACAEFGVPPHRPWSFGRCLIARDVTPRSTMLYGVRGSPVPSRGDCGWSLWASDPSFEVTADTVGFDIEEIRAVNRRAPRAWPLLALPPGWGFVLGPEIRDVFADPGILRHG